MACLSCKERGEIIARALRAGRSGDRAEVNRQMKALGRSFGTDARSVAAAARDRINVKMSSGAGRR